jgi:hypothetical protein
LWAVAQRVNEHNCDTSFANITPHAIDQLGVIFNAQALRTRRFKMKVLPQVKDVIRLISDAAADVQRDAIRSQDGDSEALDVFLGTFKQELTKKLEERVAICHDPTMPEADPVNLVMENEVPGYTAPFSVLHHWIPIYGQIHAMIDHEVDHARARQITNDRCEESMKKWKEVDCPKAWLKAYNYALGFDPERGPVKSLSGAGISAGQSSLRISGTVNRAILNSSGPGFAELLREMPTFKRRR